MLKIIRLACACLFMLWLPALQAADSGWLQNPANDHAKVRLRADTSQPSFAVYPRSVPGGENRHRTRRKAQAYPL